LQDPADGRKPNPERAWSSPLDELVDVLVLVGDCGQSNRSDD
jgi:hypothetical protein